MFAVVVTCGGLISGVRANPVITELLAANASALADEDGTFSDWLELHNPTAVPINLDGWYLTDSVSNKTKWRLPAVTLEPEAYLVVFASNKNRTNPAAPLHTNFALSADGEYLGLIKPDGRTVASEYAPTFPTQTDDVSYGRVVGADGSVTLGFLRTPTPGAYNGGSEALKLTETITFSRPSGPFAETFSLVLSGASPGQRIRYVAHSGAGGALVQVTADATEYTGPIELSSSAVVYAAVFSADDTVQGSTSRAHYLRVGSSVASFASQLPVIVLDNFGAGELTKDDTDHPSWAYAYNAAEPGAPTFSAAPMHRTAAETTVRGNSSADFPKKGYNLKLRDARDNKRELPLFQLPSAEKWALVAPWSFDQTYINNPFTYALSNRIGRWATRTQLVEVFFNAGGDDLELSDYAGIYVLTERVEPGPGRVPIAKLSSSDNSEPAITGGYILKIDAPDPAEIGWRTTNNQPDDTYSAVILSTPDEDDATPEQIAYIQNYVQRMEDALYRDGAAGFAQRTYLDYIDRDSWVDHHLLNVFVSNPDAFVRSAYFYKPRNGRLFAGPVWDFDRALGGYWDYRGETARTWSGSIEPDVDYWRSGWWATLVRDPEFMQDWVDRWQALRRSEFTNTNLVRLVDGLANSIGPDAAARDATRWPDNASATGSHAGQIDELKSWLRRRAEWIDTQFVAPPTLASDGGSITFTAPAGTQLVYTRDGSDPRSLGGGIAPNAILAAGSVALPASANLHVRSYRADLADKFPGSPWSSAVGSEASSPLRPAGRIINISTRALVGQEENALIAGIVTADTEAKRYLARAIGPGLAAFGAAGTVGDPQLSIFSSNGVELLRNNGWETGPDAARIPAHSRSVGAFPLAPGSADSALVTQLPSGTHTVQITTPTGQEGIGLAELYELDTNGRTVNLSTRANVRADSGVLIGGFVVAGPAYKRMLIRAVGPTLGGFGVGNALADTVLTIFSGQTVVATNDRWENGGNTAALTAATQNVGAFALAAGSEDAALLVTLAPGAYTVEVKGKAGAEGVALLEIYEVP
ncbi:MAG: CotH kinase family protein [Verrucomicrobiota bacterium]